MLHSWINTFFTWFDQEPHDVFLCTCYLHALHSILYHYVLLIPSDLCLPANTSLISLWSPLLSCVLQNPAQCDLGEVPRVKYCPVLLVSFCTYFYRGMSCPLSIVFPTRPCILQRQPLFLPFTTNIWVYAKWILTYWNHLYTTRFNLFLCCLNFF